MHKRILAFSIAMFALCGIAYGQVDTGSLAGIVTDPIGASVATATVTATNLGTNAVRTTSTSANGTYSLGELPAAVYTVVIQAPGFQPVTAQVEITVGGHAPFDAKLTVTGTTQTVEVTALGGAQVNTDSDEISEIITPEQVSQLPSLTRNVYDFVGIAGNVSNGDAAQGHSENSTNLGVGYSINGQRSSGTEILLDGVENTEIFDDVVGIHVPIDSISEVRVTTSNFEPQYGRASGGVVNVVTASGTNRFHGTVSEFNRLAAYTANSVTNDLQGTPKGGYTRNQFGFFVSGPVVKDKLFFAVGTEWLRVRSSENVQSYVLTPQIQPYLASNVQAFLSQYGQTFTTASTLTNEQAYAAVYPNAAGAGVLFPNAPGTTPAVGLVNYQVPQDAGGGEPQNTYNDTFRVDWNASERTQIFARYIGYSLSEPLGAAAYSAYSSYDVGSSQKDFASLAGVTHSFSSTLLTTGRLGFSRINLNNNTTPQALTTPDLFLGGSANIGGMGIALPGTGYGLPFGGPQNVLQWNQDVAWSKHSHAVQGGSQILYIQENRTFGAYAQAEEELGGTPAPSGKPDSSGISGLTSGILGTFETAVNPNGAYRGRRSRRPLRSQTSPAATASTTGQHTYRIHGVRFRN